MFHFTTKQDISLHVCLLSQALELEVPDIPRDPSRGLHVVPLDRVLYIEQSDFRQARNYIILIDSQCEGKS